MDETREKKDLKKIGAKSQSDSLVKLGIKKNNNT